ncbi:MAG: prepilin-type N-terminal cleavage/methylation domain-containing protein [Gemmataceae bacterium]|nr:prepilin-type N-terminal cleavage/methylation domain-containing protein [Gemmataceae bacterium]MDW8263942.1 prepilin-type N-terminal cleavage/methylation domain-containing protein [Gemmataceae bacterium]
MTCCNTRPYRRGLTLIELVVVLVILAAVAMLVIPRLGYVKEQADAAQAAAGAADVMNNLELFKTQTGVYPARMDSLLVGPTGPLISSLWLMSSTSQVPFEVGSLPTGSGNAFTTSLSRGFNTRLGNGNNAVYFMDHDPSVADQSNSGTILRTWNSASDQYAMVRSTDTALIQAAGYADGVIPSNVRLIVLGVGPRNAAVGRTMASAPRHALARREEYGRFLAIFALYQNGKPAELKVVVDSRRATIETRIGQFKDLTLTND